MCGLVLGAALPWIVATFAGDALPVPPQLGVYPAPLLIATAIDSSIVDHRYPLAPLLAAIAVLSVLRAWVNYRRRYATSRVGVAIEARLRELLYEQYLRYPRPFYDRQPTGQVLSRATNDLYPVRYFIGWGLVQAVQSSMLIVGTGVLLALTNWQLALWSALRISCAKVPNWWLPANATASSR